MRHIPRSWPALHPGLLLSGPLLSGLLLSGLFLVAGCAERAESAPLEAQVPGMPVQTQAGADAAEAGAPTPDPVALYLGRRGPDEAREAEILEELRQALADARDERAAREGRRAAINRFDALVSQLAVAEDWRPLLRAELLAPLGDTAAVDAALEAVDPATGIVARWGWSLRVDAYEAAGDLAGAWKVAEVEALRARSVEEAASPWARAGRLALLQGDTAAARDALLRAMAAGVEHPGAASAAEALTRIHEGSLEDQLRVGQTLLAAGSWDLALRRLGPLVQGRSAQEHSPLPREVELSLRAELGRALVELRRPADARAMLAPLLVEGVDPELTGPALYWSGRAALQLDRPAEAEAAFLALARQSPSNPLAENALLLLVERSVQAGRQARDAELFREFFRVGVSSTASELVAVQYGTRKYLAGAWEEAADTFDRYLDGARRSAPRQQAAYWAALSHQRRGDREAYQDRLRAAWSEDPLSFYGILAGERLGAVVLEPGLPTGPAPVPGLAGELRSALTRLRLHQVVPTPGSFVYELERLQDHFFRRGDGAYDFAEALFAGGFPIQGVVLGREIHRQEEGAWNLRLLRIVFPFPHRDAIVREARARGLDPFFVAGLIRQESMFHVSISSSAGAIGLMQLMPGTAQEVARSLGIRYEQARLSDPEYNVRLGTQYLASMLRRYDGRAEDALAAYNAGPGRINQWRQRPEYRDRDVFMEHIPFRETRHYVKVVQQYTRIYTALYGCAGFQPCLGDSYLAAVARSPYAGGQPGSSLAR